jgi:hypothetical protein
MRLLDDEGNRPLNKIWVYLTEGEARMLAGQLTALFADDERPREWHSHVESDEGRAKELTLALYDPEVRTDDQRWQDWFKDDRWTSDMFDSGPTP